MCQFFGLEVCFPPQILQSFEKISTFAPTQESLNQLQVGPIRQLARRFGHRVVRLVFPSYGTVRNAPFEVCKDNTEREGKVSQRAQYSPTPSCEWKEPTFNC